MRRGRRVVVTGLGVISPVGSGVAAFWDALMRARHGFAEIRSFDASSYRTKVGAEVKDFSPRSALAYALAAAREALADAGTDQDAAGLRGAGVSLGTALGESLAVEREMDRRLAGGSRARMISRLREHGPAGIAARLAASLGCGGPNLMATTACCAANVAIGWAYDKIRFGHAELMLAGGVDVFCRQVFAGFNKLYAVAPDVCRPFSAGRKGLIPGEGSAVLVLEEAGRAARRGATPYAEILGYGLSSDASHPTMPDAGGIGRAIADGLANAGLKPSDVDYINAHGTGTPANDRAETLAIKKALGRAARRVPISSIKSMLGHALGAASALEAAACCLSLRTGMLPPTAHFVGGDPECDLDYVPRKARKARPRVILSNAFAFGGSNAVIALAKAGARRPPLGARKVRVAITGLATVGPRDPIALADRLLPDKDTSYLDQPMAYALCGVKLALVDAGLWPRRRFSRSAGIILDSAGESGSLFRFYKDLAEGGAWAVEPRLFPNELANAAASRAAIVFGLEAANLSLAGSFPAGESALVQAYDYFQGERRGILLAGGVGRGACLMVVETLAAARRRKARIYAELVSYEQSFDPRARMPRETDCFRLAKALSAFSARGRGEMRFKGTGIWGGRISLDLRSVRL